MRFTGTEGSDYIEGSDSDDILEGLGGDDDITLSGSYGEATVHGGAGSDRFAIYLSGASYTLSLGAAADTITLHSVDVGHAAMVVTDFDTGANGDVLIWDAIPHYMTGIPTAAIRLRRATRECSRADPTPCCRSTGTGPEQATISKR